MAKIRVHELAKEMGLNSRDLVNRLLALGIQVKNHFSTLDEAEAIRVKPIIINQLSDAKEGNKKEERIKTKTQTEQKSRISNVEERILQSQKSEFEEQETVTKRLTPINNRTGKERFKAGTGSRLGQGDHDFRSSQRSGQKDRDFRSGQRSGQRGRDFKSGPNSQGDRDFRSGPGPDQRGFGTGGQRNNHSRGYGSGPRTNDNRGYKPGPRINDRSKEYGLSGNLTDKSASSDRGANKLVIPRPEGVLQATASRVSAKGKTTERDKARALGLDNESPKKTSLKKRSGRVYNEWNAEDNLQDRGRKPRKTRPRKRNESVAPSPPAPILPKEVTIDKNVTVQELAAALNLTPANLIKKLMSIGVLATATQSIDFDTAALVCAELGIEAKSEISKEEELLVEIVDDPKDMVERPPVVTVMGHVDHGKTSLLDAIRCTRVIENEAGGITQHIGAYQVEVNQKKITFIDTPGHEAFTSMRARGAEITDIAILVVAADEGVMPQTIEAISHARAAEVPIIVAINKIDKPTADSDKIKQQLTEHGLISEEWGGDTIFVLVSAHTKEGLDNLLEMILLVSEMSELKANPNRPAKGTVIEAQLDKGRGPVATVLVQCGTLRTGDSVLVGLTSGKVRAMVDCRGQWVKEAPPSTPVEILGLDSVPMAGDILQVVTEEKIARQIKEIRVDQKREVDLQRKNKVSLDDLFKYIQKGQVKELNIIVKADVQGSMEALCQSLEKLSTDEVRVNIVHAGVGTIKESDVMLASASNAIIVGFNVRPDQHTRKAAEREEIDLRFYRVIYEAVDDIKKAMSGLLEPEWKEVILGRAEVRKTFKVPKAVVAGCYVLDGKIIRGGEIRVIRDGIVIQDSKVDSLRRFKDDVKEVSQGYECGIGLENFNDIKEGDVFEAYTMEKIERSL